MCRDEAIDDGDNGRSPSSIRSRRQPLDDRGGECPHDVSVERNFSHSAIRATVAVSVELHDVEADADGASSELITLR